MSNIPTSHVLSVPGLALILGPARVRADMTSHRLVLALAALLLVGSSCTSVHMTREEITCVEESDCPEGERCAALIRTGRRICAIACDRSTTNLCEDGAVCDDVCLPGSIAPRAECLWSRQCAFGQSCRRRVGQTAGACVDACADDVECAAGEACLHAVCTPVCDARDPASCPDGFGCTFYGSCLPRDCPPSIGEEDVPNGCDPLGTCQGYDPAGACLSPPAETELGYCGPEAQLGPTFRCYPRRDLRPVR
jgi:hypothetical protein